MRVRHTAVPQLRERKYMKSFRHRQTLSAKNLPLADQFESSKVRRRVKHTDFDNSSVLQIVLHASVWSATAFETQQLAVEIHWFHHPLSTPKSLR